ncbi:MAG: tyrosinase family protein [Candidatus Eremiobacteraeota bacterium]|nr:tyrosinase family protein [Candidatus Eremiobacteraeota bacterium]
MSTPPPPADNDPVVPNPTYMGYIRGIFTQDDIDHMAPKGVDLSTYAGVKKNAINVYIQTLQPGGPMPPAPYPKWSANRSLNFKAWIVDKYPLGTAEPHFAAFDAVAAPTAGARLRKDVNSLSADEIKTLKAAFQGIIALDASQPNNPNGYYQVAGIHWFPTDLYCQHHVQQYNPWHRLYVRTFEDALRSIPGCENVTLPYWDIATYQLPQLFSEPPFNQYTAPQGVGNGYPVPFATSRYDDATIVQNLRGNDVAGSIRDALQQSRFGSYETGGFQKFIIQAHDDGHVSTGRTMRDQGVASFDPIFWFFHCNWDRLFLSWQTLVNGTTLNGFKSTLDGDTSWLDFPQLQPWTQSSADAVPAEPDVRYAQLATEVQALQHRVGSIDAFRSFSIAPSSRVSVRVKNINRLNIPGTFVVKLLADGEEVARHAFFQPSTPEKCPTCKEHGLVPIDFHVDLEKVQGRKMSVAIEVPDQEEVGAAFPLSQAGNPTINARLLLEEA